MPALKNVQHHLHLLTHYDVMFNHLDPTGHVMHQQFDLLKPTGYVMHQQFNLLKPTGYVMHWLRDAPTV